MYLKKMIKFVLYIICLSGVGGLSATAQISAPAPFVTLPNGLADMLTNIHPALVQLDVNANRFSRPQKDGTGVIISAYGEVVTHSHLIKNDNSIRLLLQDGTPVQAELISRDKDTGLALLQIQNAAFMPSLRLYEGNDLRVGDYVITIGNPFGIGLSTSLGILSTLNLHTRQGSHDLAPFIQTDSLNHITANGGFLFNLSGEIVGISSPAYTPMDSKTNPPGQPGFALPYKQAGEIIRRMQQNNPLRHQWFGASMARQQDEVVIYDMNRRSLASQYGLHIGDVILTLNSTPITQVAQAKALLAVQEPGQKVQIGFRRGLQENLIEINVAHQDAQINEFTPIPIDPPPSAVSPDSKKETDSSLLPGQHGLTLVPLSPSFRESVGADKNATGLYIEQVRPDSTAFQQSLVAGMILIQANGTDVRTPQDFARLYQRAQQHKQANIILKLRQQTGELRYVNLPINY